MSRQVDVASGGLCEQKEFSRRILSLLSAERLIERAPSTYCGLGYAVLLGIVHRMLPWRRATQALDSTVTLSQHHRVPDRAQGAPAAPCPDTDFLGALLVYCPPLRRNPSDYRGRLPRCRLLDSFAEPRTRRARKSITSGFPVRRGGVRLLSSRRVAPFLRSCERDFSPSEGADAINFPIADQD
jgi:hypothetical protein